MCQIVYFALGKEGLRSGFPSEKSTVRAGIIDWISVGLLLPCPQAMDALNSQSSLTGDVAGMLATQHLCKAVPMMKTPAGTIPRP